jgi:hypothetical protein
MDGHFLFAGAELVPLDVIWQAEREEGKASHP